MGSKYRFTCPECGYKALVSGGRDVGMSAVVRTMTCSDCIKLVDVLIGRCGQDGPSGDPDFDKDLGLCPSCNGQNVKPWSSKHQCPRCGSKMDKGRGPTLMWD